LLMRFGDARYRCAVSTRSGGPVPVYREAVADANGHRLADLPADLAAFMVRSLPATSALTRELFWIILWGREYRPTASRRQP
jgi:hypothetical protein